MGPWGYGRNLQRLVVASDQRHHLRVHHLQTEQVLQGFDRVIAAVDIVPQENVVSTWDLPARLE